MNQLRQMQRTLETLKTLRSSDKNFNLQRVLDAFPFSHVEILARIAKTNPDVAIDAMSGYFSANRPPSYRELRERFYEVRSQATQASPIAAGQQTSRAFETLCFNLLKQENAQILYGAEQAPRRRIIKWPSGFRYASPDIIIGIRDEDGRLQIDAVDCYAIYGDISQDETARRVSRVATESTFFRNFWIMLPTWSVRSLVESMCRELKLDNVGIVDVDPQTREAFRAVEPSGPPVPDRRDLVLAAVKKHFEKMA